MSTLPVPSRSAVFVAHPGHELRIHHWMELQRPTVLVLTDGSGRTADSRVASTARLLKAAGAQPGPIFGRYSDRHLYDRLLARDEGFFIDIARELVGFLERAGIDLLVGDAAEGYNPSHDICHYLIDAGVARLRHQTGRRIARYQFLLVGRPDECPPAQTATAIWVRLDELALQRKLAAAQSYPELADEVARARREHGIAPFAVECLQPLDGVAGPETDADGTRFYETHGDRQKAAGFYAAVIRYREHLEPVRAALANWARSGA